MGIINVTPDSFFDGGLCFRTDDAIDHAKKLIEEGADILDVGGESTRPGATPVSVEEEIERVVPVIEGIRRFSDIPISVDTSKSAVAKAAVEAGADMVNDVSAGTHDESMLELIAKKAIPICLMHMRGTPENMQMDTTYNDIISEITDYLRNRIEISEKRGVAPQKIIVDPGIGFGKSAQDNVKLISNINRLSDLGKPILIGPSRKSFIGKLLGYDINQRLESTLATLSKSYESGARIFRVHDVAPAKRYLSTVQLLNDPAL
jgi:dihydropteroate synthase